MLFDKLKNYCNDGIYPFHMPGHKRVSINGDTILPYQIDITEIDGFDDLHNASGCIRDVEKKAEKLYSVNRAYLLVNGATGGILSAIRALTHFGDDVIIARNCHKSVYNAAELCGLSCKYIMPEFNEKYGIFTSVSPTKLEKLLNSNPNTKLVVITSPTYEGVVSDINSISQICREHGALLFVDEAHGAHFPFSDKFPCEAVSCGADVAVVSLHKTLPSFTQTALLLTNNPVLSEKLKENLSIFQTSSPSYVLMSSIDNCLDYIFKNKDNFSLYIKRLKSFYSLTHSLENITVLYNDKEFLSSCYKFDIGKIIISTSATNISGVELASVLRDKYKIELEMAYTNYALAMTSVCDSDKGFGRLLTALQDIDSKIIKMSENSSRNNYFSIPKQCFKANLKSNYQSEKVLLKDAKGKVSAQYLWAYPPGIPIIVPGEYISDNIIKLIDNMNDKNINIGSENNLPPQYIYIAKTD